MGAPGDGNRFVSLLEEGVYGPGYRWSEGRVFTFQGGPDGLSPWQGFGQEGLATDDAPDGDWWDVGDWFGSALAAGDFNGDGRDDLAVGAPGEAPGVDPKSGWVSTFQGGPDGLFPWKGFGQEGLGSNEEGDFFGEALAAGDFNGDGRDDLAVGAPGEAPGVDPKSGWVSTFQGGPDGLFPWKGFGQEGLGMNEARDEFGRAVAAGDFNGDGTDDLAVGAPGEAPDVDPRSGWVFTFQGGPEEGLSPWKGFGQEEGHGDERAP